MTTVRTVVTHALRLNRVLGINRNPTSSEGEAGLNAFQSLFDGWIAGGMFGKLAEVYKTANYTADENERVTAPTAITVTFPTSVDDTDEGGSRAPRDLSIIETVLNGVRVVKLYDRGAWVNLLGLTLDSDAPLASRGAMGLAACLACSGAFVDMFGKEPSPNTIRLSSMFLTSLSYKLGTTRDKLAVEYM